MSIAHLRYSRFESFKEYEALINTLLLQTETVVRVFDHTLPVAWNSMQREALLRQFLRRNPQNRLHLVLHETDDVVRKLPRLIKISRDFGHAFTIRRTPKTARHWCDAFITFDANHYLHRFHHARMRAAVGMHDIEATQQLRDRHLELWAVSTPVTFSAVGGL